MRGSRCNGVESASAPTPLPPPPPPRPEPANTSASSALSLATIRETGSCSRADTKPSSLERRKVPTSRCGSGCASADVPPAAPSGAKDPMLPPPLMAALPAEEATITPCVAAIVRAADRIPTGRLEVTTAAGAAVVRDAMAVGAPTRPAVVADVPTSGAALMDAPSGRTRPPTISSSLSMNSLLSALPPVAERATPAAEAASRPPPATLYMLGASASAAALTPPLALLPSVAPASIAAPPAPIALPPTMPSAVRSSASLPSDAGSRTSRPCSGGGSVGETSASTPAPSQGTRSRATASMGRTCSAAATAAGEEPEPDAADAAPAVPAPR